MSSTLTTSNLVIFREEPRLLDTDLAKALGFNRPRVIRDLIKRNHDELTSYGDLAELSDSAASCGASAAKANSAVPAPRLGGQTSKVRRGGAVSASQRGATMYLLNEQQALLVCMFSRTQKAAEVRRALIDVFVAYRRGALQAPPQADERKANRIRHAKLALVSVVNRLDALGVDVSSISMPTVLDFSRRLNRIGRA